jgi:PAS domain S-box-containing protein
MRTNSKRKLKNILGSVSADISGSEELQDEKGQIVGLQGIARHVMERTLVEHEVNKEKHFSEAVIDSLPGIFYVIGEGLSFQLYNKNVLEVTGYTAEEVPQLHALDIICQEDRELVVAMLAEAFTQGIASIEANILTKGGKKIPYYLFGKYVQIGEKEYVLGMGIDITERKIAEAAREESEKNYRLLAENTSDVVSIFDMHWNILWASPSNEKQTGFTPEELKKLRVGKQLSPESLEMTMEMVVTAMEEEKTGLADPDRHKDLELEIYRKDGSAFFMESRFKFIRDGQGKAVGILMQGRDITERKQAEIALQKTVEDLKRSNEELEQFAYVASHDLQEPLRMVSSYVQLLEKRYKDNLDGDAHDFINYAVSGSRRMHNMINDLLSYSRVGTRGKPFKPVEFTEIFNAAMSNLEVAIREAGAVVEHGELPRVIVDEGQMVQVVQNLVGNAVKFHGETPPVVRVDSVRKDGDWVFSVKDNGIGIDPQYFERILLVFKRLHRDEYPGTGIGLSVANRIVQRHNGRIWLESEPGKGTTFYFTIPVREKGEKDLRQSVLR